METKVCKDCSIEKPIDEFLIRRYRKDGSAQRMVRCRKCNAAMSKRKRQTDAFKVWYSKKKEEGYFREAAKTHRRRVSEDPVLCEEKRAYDAARSRVARSECQDFYLRYLLKNRALRTTNGCLSIASSQISPELIEFLAAFLQFKRAVSDKFNVNYGNTA